jgi:hypothetical protein
VRSRFLMEKERDDLARRALEIFDSIGVRKTALAYIEDEFEVSTSTAQNLVSRGRYLRMQETS